MSPHADLALMPRPSRLRFITQSESPNDPTKGTPQDIPHCHSARSRGRTPNNRFIIATILTDVRCARGLTFASGADVRPPNTRNAGNSVEDRRLACSVRDAWHSVDVPVLQVVCSALFELLRIEALFGYCQPQSRAGNNL